MVIRVAINGFGRIGRCVFKIGLEDPEIEFVAINDLTDAANLAYLLKYDTAYGKYQKNVDSKVNGKEQFLIVNGKKIPVLAEKDPEKLPWKKLNVDVVIESTGRFTEPEQAEIHRKAGAKKVLVSAPFKSKNGKYMLMGINDSDYDKSNIVSNASCTTNASAPLIKVVHENFKIKHGYLVTIHGYTQDQRLQDSPHERYRRGRAAAENIVPTSSGAEKAILKAFPELDNKIEGLAMRVPVLTGSIVEFVAEVKNPTTVEEVNKTFKKAANTYLKGVLEYSEDELVSSDIKGNPHSSIFDSKLTKVIDKTLIKVSGWYDNEWGFSARMIDIIKSISKKKQ